MAAGDAQRGSSGRRPARSRGPQQACRPPRGTMADGAGVQDGGRGVGAWELGTAACSLSRKKMRRLGQVLETHPWSSRSDELASSSWPENVDGDDDPESDGVLMFPAPVEMTGRSNGRETGERYVTE